jgi:hypothetical protein
MIIADFGVSAANPSVLSLATNVKTNFMAPGLSTPSATDATGQLTLPSGFNGQRLKVVLAGDITTGDVLNSTIYLRANTGTLLAPVYQDIAFAPHVADPAGTFPWFIVAEFEGTTASLRIGGDFEAVMDNSMVQQILSTKLSGYDINTGLGLVAAVRFSTANPGNSASLYQFQILSE